MQVIACNLHNYNHFYFLLFIYFIFLMAMYLVVFSVGGAEVSKTRPRLDSAWTPTWHGVWHLWGRSLWRHEVISSSGFKEVGEALLESLKDRVFQLFFFFLKSQSTFECIIIFSRCAWLYSYMYVALLNYDDTKHLLKNMAFSNLYMHKS